MLLSENSKNNHTGTQSNPFKIAAYLQPHFCKERLRMWTFVLTTQHTRERERENIPAML